MSITKRFYFCLSISNIDEITQALSQYYGKYLVTFIKIKPRLGQNLTKNIFVKIDLIKNLIFFVILCLTK